MRNAETVLGVLRERGRQGLPLERLYRQLFNPQLYLMAYGRIYSNQGAMTPGATAETVDGMSLNKIGRVIDALRELERALRRQRRERGASQREQRAVNRRLRRRSDEDN